MTKEDFIHQCAELGLIVPSGATGMPSAYYTDGCKYTGIYFSPNLDISQPMGHASNGCARVAWGNDYATVMDACLAVGMDPLVIAARVKP